MLQRLVNRILRKPNPIKSGSDLFLSYSKPVSDWTVQERKDYNHLVARPKIKGLPELKVKATVMPEERAGLTEVFANAQKQLTEIKFGES